MAFSRARLGFGLKAFACLCSGVVLVLTSSASSVVGRWEVVPIADLGFTPNVDDYGGMAINNAGQCCYGTMVSGNMHAFIYLPAAAYGYTAGRKDLNVLSSTTESLPNIARDINEYGIAVGQSGSEFTYGAGNATVWKVSSSTSTPVTVLGTLSSSSPFSAAHAVSNDPSDPIIVGDSAFDAICFCEGGETASPLVRAFYTPFPSSGLTQIVPGDNDKQNHARDVNLGNAKVGWAGCSGNASNSEFCGEPSGCAPNEDAVEWISTRTTLDDLSSTGAANAQANNENGQICGWGRRPAGDAYECHKAALFWDSATATEVNLGNTMPSGQTYDQSRAEGMNNTTLVDVVGWNDDAQTGLFWEQGSGGGFTVWDLNSSASIGSYNTTWDIRQAHDVNNDEWIIAWGIKLTEPNQYHVYALLLIPDTTGSLMGDSNGDSAVDSGDLEKVISSYGACPEELICEADMTADYLVNGDDLREVLHWYGSTPEDVVEPIPTEVIDMWLAAGGEEAVAEGKISADDIAAAMSEESPSLALLGTLEEE